jgi:hypothetical protein
MTLTRKQEERFLSAEERELVERTHHPAIAGLPDDELANLRKLVRERRDRATGISRRQRREMRGKAAPKGAAPASGNEGSMMKVGLLAQAMKRLNRESSRRQKISARSELTVNMRKALAMKRAAAKPKRPASRTAGKGMADNPNQKAEQITDPREVGRVSQFVKVGQARRDR